MINFIKNFIQKDRSVTVLDIFLVMLCADVTRSFLEHFSNPGSGDFFASIYFVFFWYLLFFVFTALILLIILFYFTKVSVEKLASFSIFFLPIVCLPPIIDLLVTKGHGLCMSYLIEPNLKNFLTDFLTFFGQLDYCGITIGMRVEILLVCITIFVFIYYLTQKKLRALIGALTSYAFIFFSLAFPSLIMLNSSDSKGVFFNEMFNKSLLKSVHNFGFIPSNSHELFFQQTGIFMSRCGWILVVIELLIILFVAYRSVWNAWVKNLRPERVLYYCLIAIFGMSVSYKVNGSWPTLYFPDILAFIIFFVLIALSFWLAVIINDIEDVPPKDNPIEKTGLTIEQSKTIGTVILFLILMGAPLLNYPVFIFIILFQLIYYIYSKKPFQLKRYFFIASPLLAFNALLIAMAGFFLISANQKFLAFPVENIWFILIGFSIFVNIKDFTDIERDEAVGVKTLPVIFGREKAKKIMTFLIIAFLIIFSFYKQSSYLLFSSVILSATTYIFLNKTSFKETRLFYLLYLYIIAVMLVL